MCEKQSYDLLNQNMYNKLVITFNERDKLKLQH